MLLAARRVSARRQSRTLFASADLLVGCARWMPAPGEHCPTTRDCSARPSSRSLSRVLVGSCSTFSAFSLVVPGIGTGWASVAKSTREAATTTIQPKITVDKARIILEPMNRNPHFTGGSDLAPDLSSRVLSDYPPPQHSQATFAISSELVQLKLPQNLAPFRRAATYLERAIALRTGTPSMCFPEGLSGHARCVPWRLLSARRSTAVKPASGAHREGSMARRGPGPKQLLTR